MEFQYLTIIPALDCYSYTYLLYHENGVIQAALKKALVSWVDNQKYGGENVIPGTSIMRNLATGSLGLFYVVSILCRTNNGLSNPLRGGGLWRAGLRLTAKPQ